MENIEPNNITFSDYTQWRRDYLFGNIVTNPYEVSFTDSNNNIASLIYGWNTLIKKAEKEDNSMHLEETSTSRSYKVYCKDTEDLSVNKILTTISATKGKLQFNTLCANIKEIICTMTPEVRNNIIKASKKLKMYGKKMPIIARFDEYGNRLPDTIDIGFSQGITVNVVLPESVGDEQLYFELKAINFPIDKSITEITTELPF